MALPLAAQTEIRQVTQVTKTERVDFAPGGLIRLDTASGNLSVEAWDQPEVEITTVRSSWKDARCEGTVQIVTDKLSTNELAVMANLPPVTRSHRMWNR